VRLLEGRAERLTETLRRMQAALSRSAHVAESRLERLGNALEKAGPRVRVSVMSERTRALAERLKKVAPRLAGATEQRLQLAARSLEGVSPLRVLARGYSTTSMQAADGARASLVDVDQLTVGMAIETRLAKGRLRSTVTELLPSDEEPA